MRTRTWQMFVAAVVVSAGRGRTATPHSDTTLPPPPSNLVCDQHGRPQIYVDCALWFDLGRLRRGARGEVLAKEGIAPIRLSGLVTGDSALRYAVVYEQLGWISAPMKFLSYAGLTTAVVLDRR